MSTIYIWIGTVAELIKLLPVIIEFKEKNVHFKIIASGQNDIRKDSDLLKMAAIEHIDITLTNKRIKQTPMGLFVWTAQTFILGIIKLHREFGIPFRRKNTYAIVHGDTITTLLGTFITKFYGLKVAHVEAGLRSFDFKNPFPEEITRVIVSKLADTHLCPNQWCVDNLKNRHGKKVNTQYNTSIETLHMALKQHVHSDVLQKTNKRPYFIFLLHRNEHLADKEEFKRIVQYAISESEKMLCVFILHKPTKLVLENLGILDTIEHASTIIPVERLPYVEFMNVLKNCEFIITDGGSTQEESYFLGKPCLLIRKCTERIEGLDSNVVLSKNDMESIKTFRKNYMQYRREPISIGQKPSSIIFKSLVE